MPEPSKAVRSYLEKASPRFREVYAAIERTVRGLFPDAQTAFEFRIPGWKIPRRRRVDPKSVRGTLDPNWVQVYLAERKSGITLHLWNPVDFYALRARKAELERAGFKVMVGCIVFNRKSEYPVGLATDVLKDVKIALDKDARGDVSARPRRAAPATATPGPRRGEPMDPVLRREIEEWASEPPMHGGD